MPDEDEAFPVPETVESRPDEAGGGLKCPDCEATFDGELAKMRLGGHRFRVHGVKGTGRSSRRRQRGRAGSSKPRERTSEPTPPSKSKLLREAQSSLEDTLGFLGGLLSSGPLPLPGDYLVATKEEGARTVVAIAKRNDRVLGWLTGASVATDYVALGMWCGGLLAAVAVNLSRLPHDHPLAQAGGVTQLALERYGEQALIDAYERTHAVEQPGAVERPGPWPTREGAPGDDLGNGQAPAAGVVASSTG